MQSTITKSKAEVKIKNKSYPRDEVRRVLDLLSFLPEKPKTGYKAQNEDLAWSLWGIGVLKPHRTVKRIFEPLQIFWKIGPNYSTLRDKIEKLYENEKDAY